MSTAETTELFSVKNKVALVTGGSRGIGFMIAEGLVQAGAHVYICGRQKETIEAAAERLSPFGRCHAVVADVTSEADLEGLLSELAKREARLDILVNNAGAVVYESMEKVSRKAFRDVLDVNLMAPFELTRRSLPLLRAAASPESPARVINIVSVDALMVSRFESYPYTASKAGLAHLTRLLAARLASQSITVNAIAPGLFRSEMTEFLFEGGKVESVSMRIPLRRVGEMPDIAGAVIFLSSRAGSYITGVVLPVSGGAATAQ